MDRFLKMLIDNYVGMEIEVAGRIYPQLNVTFSRGEFCKEIVLMEEDLLELNEIGAEDAFMIELEKFLNEIRKPMEFTTKDEKQIARIAREIERDFGR